MQTLYASVRDDRVVGGSARPEVLPSAGGDLRSGGDASCGYGLCAAVQYPRGRGDAILQDDLRPARGEDVACGGADHQDVGERVTGLGDEAYTVGEPGEDRDVLQSAGDGLDAVADGGGSGEAAVHDLLPPVDDSVGHLGDVKRGLRICGIIAVVLPCPSIPHVVMVLPGGDVRGGAADRLRSVRQQVRRRRQAAADELSGVLDDGVRSAAPVQKGCCREDEAVFAGWVGDVPTGVDVGVSSHYRL
jgi:hypothetical protein